MTRSKSALANKCLKGACEPQYKFYACLAPEQEVMDSPPGPSEVESDTHGSIELCFNKCLSKVSYKLCICKGVKLTQGHIHNAPAGANGPVVAFVLDLNEQAPTIEVASGGKNFSDCVSGCITNSDILEGSPLVNVAAIYRMARMGNLYVNIHSEAEPAGVIRGQIFPCCGL